MLCVISVNGRAYHPLPAPRRWYCFCRWVLPIGRSASRCSRSPRCRCATGCYCASSPARFCFLWNWEKPGHVTDALAIDAMQRLTDLHPAAGIDVLSRMQDHALALLQAGTTLRPQTGAPARGTLPVPRRPPPARIDVLSRMHDHALALLQAATTLRHQTGAPARGNLPVACPPVLDHKYAPGITFAKQRAGRYLQYIAPLPQDKPGFDPVSIAQILPVLTLSIEVDNHPDPLLFHAQRGKPGKPGGLHPAHPTGKDHLTAPALDLHGHTRTQPHRIGRQHIHFHLQAG